MMRAIYKGSSTAIASGNVFDKIIDFSRKYVDNVGNHNLLDRRNAVWHAVTKPGQPHTLTIYPTGKSKAKTQYLEITTLPGKESIVQSDLGNLSLKAVLDLLQNQLD